MENLAGENFGCLNMAEATIAKLQTENAALLDKVDDLENRSRRANLRIVNVPEGNENCQDPVKFVCEMLMQVMRNEVFEKPPELERAHRSLAPKPNHGNPPRSIIVCFHQFQEKERALWWARQHELRFQGKVLRTYLDLSAVLSKTCAAFKGIKQQALYQKGIRFQMLHPAHLRVRFSPLKHLQRPFAYGYLP